MRNRPGPPSASAKPCTQVDETLHSAKCRLRAPWSPRAPARRPRARARDRAAASLALAIGFARGASSGAAALYYSHARPALSHYDARAHLVVARRIFDSLTPGWQQVGAVWLPLPHLLNMLPVQIDCCIAPAPPAIAISVASMARRRVGAVASLILPRHRVVAAARSPRCAAVLNPNVLYLQSTPMTEPLLFATTMLAALALTAAWIDRGAPRWPHAAGLALAAACLTRYEAWPIAALRSSPSAASVLLRRGASLGRTARACLAARRLPAVADRAVPGEQPLDRRARGS